MAAPFDFSAESAEIGSGWRVVIEFGPGRFHYVGGFESKPEADSWIRNHAREWLNLRTTGL